MWAMPYRNFHKQFFCQGKRISMLWMNDLCQIEPKISFFYEASKRFRQWTFQKQLALSCSFILILKINWGLMSSQRRLLLTHRLWIMSCSVSPYFWCHICPCKFMHAYIYFTFFSVGWGKRSFEIFNSCKQMFCGVAKMWGKTWEKQYSLEMYVLMECQSDIFLHMKNIVLPVINYLIHSILQAPQRSSVHYLNSSNVGFFKKVPSFCK